MSKGDTFENDWMKLVFNATAIANLADNAASSPLTVLYIALHTADPGESGTQSTSECNFTGYARVSINRASGAGGITVSTNTATNASTVTFPTCTAGSNTATYFSIGVASSGATKILYSGALTSSVVISTGNPVATFAASALTITED